MKDITEETITKWNENARFADLIDDKDTDISWDIYSEILQKYPILVSFFDQYFTDGTEISKFTDADIMRITMLFTVCIKMFEEINERNN